MVWLTLALQWCVKNWRVCVLLAFLAAVVAAQLYLRHKWREEGRSEERAKHEAIAAKQRAELEQLRTKQSKVTVKVETRYLDRVKVIREKGQTIVREVKVFVPADSPELPGGFRVLHDAAAGNVLPDPARIADAAAVPAQTAAETVAGNYAVCHENAAALTELQAWVREQRAVAGP